MNEEKPGMGVADMEAMFVPLCQHKFVFLRQEPNTSLDYTTPNPGGYGYHIATTVDVFFCERCLVYWRVAR